MSLARITRALPFQYDVFDLVQRPVWRPGCASISMDEMAEPIMMRSTIELCYLLVLKLLNLVVGVHCS